MSTQTDALSVYRELAEKYHELGQLPMRDRFLMLAADAALAAGLAAEAERLRLWLLHQNRHHMLRPYRSFEEHLATIDRYTTTMADQLHAEGRSASVLDWVLRPPVRFLGFYLLRGGFLDGWRGLLLALLAAHYVRLKYAKLWLRSRA